MKCPCGAEMEERYIFLRSGRSTSLYWSPDIPGSGWSLTTPKASAEILSVRMWRLDRKYWSREAYGCNKCGLVVFNSAVLTEKHEQDHESICNQLYTEHYGILRKDVLDKDMASLMEKGLTSARLIGEEGPEETSPLGLGVPKSPSLDIVHGNRLRKR